MFFAVTGAIAGLVVVRFRDKLHACIVIVINVVP